MKKAHKAKKPSDSGGSGEGQEPKPEPEPEPEPAPAEAPAPPPTYSTGDVDWEKSKSLLYHGGAESFLFTINTSTSNFRPLRLFSGVVWNISAPGQETPCICIHTYIQTVLNHPSRALPTQYKT